MRKLIIGLNQHFGLEHNTEITRFVNDQFMTTCICEGIEFSLHEVCEDKIIRVVMDLIAEFNLSLNELVHGVLLVPCMSSSQSEFEIVAEFRPAFFQTLFGQVFVTTCRLIRGEDTFEYYGKDRHVIATDIGGNNRSVINAGFINGTLQNGATLCIFMDKEEMEGLRASYTSLKYHGSYPDEDTWSEVLQCSLFRRFATEPMSEAVFAECGERAERITKALMYGKSAFEKREFESDLIMSNYGKPIAKKIINYKASDEKRRINAGQTNAAKMSHSGLKVVVDNTRSIGPAADETAGEVVATEWGAF